MVSKVDTYCIFQVVARWRRLVAFMKALDLLHRAMCAVLHHRTAMAIEMACDGGTFFWWSPGPPPSGNERGIAPSHHHGYRNGLQWRCFRSPWTSSIGQWTRYCTIAPPWLSKWPAIEVLSFVVATSFVLSNVAKRKDHVMVHLN
jgi:hypothetical protein